MIVTIDLVLFTIHEGKVKVLLQRRDKAPYEGMLALEGGYVHENTDDTTLDTVHRVFREKLHKEPVYVEQYKSWSSKTADPRGWRISDVYYSVVPLEYLNPMPPNAELIAIDEIPEDLPMQHSEIIKGAYARIKSIIKYSSLPVYFFDKPFTLYALHKTYELFKGEEINKVSFRRFIAELDVLEPTGDKDRSRACAPADLYRLKPQYRETITRLDKSI